MMRRHLDDDIVHTIITDPEVQQKIDREWEQLQDDRETIRRIFPRLEGRVRKKKEREKKVETTSRKCRRVVDRSARESGTSHSRRSENFPH